MLALDKAVEQVEVAMTTPAGAAQRAKTRSAPAHLLLCQRWQPRHSLQGVARTCRYIIICSGLHLCNALSTYTAQVREENRVCAYLIVMKVSKASQIHHGKWRMPASSIRAVRIALTKQGNWVTTAARHRCTGGTTS